MRKSQNIGSTIFVKLSICCGLGILLLGLNGCSDNTTAAAFVGTPGTPSAKDFTILYSEPNPSIYTEGGGYVQTELDVTVTLDTNKDIALLSGVIVNFATEWGTFVPIEESGLAANTCALDVTGKCLVKWRSGKPGIPNVIGSAPTDCRVAFTAWTTGEEAYIDLNGNGSYDDNDDTQGVGSGFLDLPEPFVTTIAGGTFTVTIDGTNYTVRDSVFRPGGDLLLDVFAVNGVHDAADGLYNGSSCTHSSLCGNPSTIIWDAGLLPIADTAADPPIACS
jgi:hypothetical protein